MINWVSYSHVVQTSKDRSRFGKGDVRGVIGPESANNAQDGGALIPTLLFGIPGSGSMALLLAGFILIGVEPGVEMVTRNLDLTYIIIWSLALGSIFGAGTCVFLAKPIARLTTVPAAIIAPFMFILIFLAAFQTTRDWGDLILLIVVGVFGIYMKRFGWSRPAFMIGFILSGQLENGLYRVTQVYGFSFLERPMVIGLLVILVISLIASLTLKPEREQIDEEGAHSSRSRTPQLIFFFVLFGLVALFLIHSLDWNFATALLPRSAAIITLLMMLPLGFQMIRARQPLPMFYDSERETFEDEVDRRSNEHYILWLLSALAAIYLVGFTPATAAFVYVFLWQKARVAHWQAALGAACLVASLWGVAWLMSIRFPEGLIQDLLSLPWA